MKATYFQYFLKFKRPSGTSRGVLMEKETWFLQVEQDGRRGIGECGILRSLSYDDKPDYEEKMKWTASNIHLGEEVLLRELKHYPSIQFGVEQAFASLGAVDNQLLFPSKFTDGAAAIPINGLVWMGDEQYMKSQIDEKIAQGFKCVKLKIGALNFEAEMNLLRHIRKCFSPEQIELRVDANGGFDKSNALGKLSQLAELKIHSIEQPIMKGQYDSMADLCAQAVLPIALDEELIGVIDLKYKENLLDKIRPQYLILKPSLLGGFRACEEWIALAEERGVGWWITSALESNIGLSALAQWTFLQHSKMPQGLGTGALYTNNFESPLRVTDGQLWYGQPS